PDLSVLATEISAPALALARRNAKALGIKLDFVEGDGLTPVLEIAPVDMIVSNPPYVPQENIAGLEPEVRDHEPIDALCPGPDALRFYRLFAEEAPRYLTPEGWLLAELEADLAEATAALFSSPDWRFVELRRDMQGKYRFICAQRA
ncbi:MAG: peptide chain release factor N(5)-glutamine methyltransferase, partial [Candidatus Melainabacteria bacterium HGW-Melainabacteria-1]